MAWLSVKWNDGREEAIELTHRKPIAIGSHASSNVVVNDEDIPTLACRISWNGTAYEVVAAADDDVLLNGKRTRRRSLENRDEIQIGSVVMTLRRGKMPKAAPVSTQPEAEEHAGKDTVESENPDDPDGELGGDLDDGDELDDLNEWDDDVESLPADRETKSRIRDRLHARARRPGQQDVVRSPLIYSMAGGVVVLVVTTLALTIFLRGQSITQQFESAKAAHEAGRYSDADRDLSRFIARHSSHMLTAQARRLLAINDVDRVIRGELPDWKLGFERLNDVIGTFRDDKDFETVYGDIAERAGLISLGAANDAGRRRDPTLVQLSEQAEAVLGKYSPDAIVPESLLEKIVSSRDRSRNRLVQLDVLDEFVSRMTAANTTGDDLSVLDIAGQLANADAALATEPPVRKLRDAAFESLRQRVVTTSHADTESATRNEAAAAEWEIATIAIVDRPAGEAGPDGQPLFVWHDDTWFACDRSAGDPMWIRQLPDSFRPVSIAVPAVGVVAFDRVSRSLILVSETDGETVRSVPLPTNSEPVRPLVAGSVAFLPDGSRLHRCELNAERITATAEFGQPILAEPALVKTAGGEMLVVVGESQLVYLLDPRSLQLIDTFLLGHSSGAILSAPAAAAEYVLLCVNDAGRDRCLVKMLTVAGAAADELQVRLAAESTVEGLVTDPPVLRGRDLFVPSTPERVTVLTVTDENGGQLTRANSFVAGQANDSPVSSFLLAAADREFWFASRRLMRLRATAEAIRIIGDPIPLLQPIQPPVAIGNDIYTASQRTSTSTATLARVDTQAYRERWQVQLGADVVALIAAPNGSSVFGLTEWGDIAGVNLAAVSEESPSLVKQPLDEVAGRIRSYSFVRDRLAAVSAEQLAIIGPTGRVERRANLSRAPVAPITGWGERIVVPMSGRLQVFDTAARPAMSDFWLAESEEKPPAWTFVAPADESQLVVADTNGNIRLLTVVSGEKPHLAETSIVQIVGVVDGSVVGDEVFLLADDELVICDATTLAEKRRLSSSDFAIDANLQFIRGPNGGTYATGRAKQRSMLVRLSDMSAREIPGPPIGEVRENPKGLLLTLAREVLVLNEETLETVGSYELPTTAAGSATSFGGRICVPLIDGSIAFRRIE